ncbi:22159_t:CDS:2, partial [Entrophospora sp. SA101]
AKLEEHLANHCSKAPAKIVRKYLSIVLEHKDKAPIKKKKVENSQQTIITNYHNSIELPNSRITSINQNIGGDNVAVDVDDVIDVVDVIDVD